MSHSSYTASERRGILVIAILAMLIISGGIAASFISDNKAEAEVVPQVVEHPELIDTTDVKYQGKEHPEVSKKKAVKSSDKVNKKTHNKKVYRKRNPLDEPV